MIRITISAEAFEAICDTLPVGSVDTRTRPTSAAKSSSGWRRMSSTSSMSGTDRPRAAAT